MRTPFVVLALVAMLALAGCGAVRSFVGPDPALLAAAPTIGAALDRDSAANPQNKPNNDDAKAALGATVSAPPDGPGLLDGLGALLTAIGVPGAGLLAAGAAYWRAQRAAKETKAVGAAVEQHAALIDSVTPEEADFAAKPTT